MDTTSPAVTGTAPAISTSPAPAKTLSRSGSGPGVSPREAWLPLPASQWNADAARHLLRRAAWSAQSADVERAVADGLDATLNRLFPARPMSFPRPASFEDLQRGTDDFQAKLNATTNADERRALQKDERERSQRAMQDMTFKWFQFAATPDYSAQEKWVLFLSDIYVVSFEKVRAPEQIYLHHSILRESGFGSAPALAKAVSRSPAMIRYLDLQQSKKDAPNENFARELFELFTLGEGNYTEQDIKQAARAFTGYGLSKGRFFYNARQHDGGPKTIFGHTDNYGGDDVIDLAFRLPAAAMFVPHEMARFYLTDDALPKEYLASLGDWWGGNKEGQGNLNLRALAHRFFGSRLFFDPLYTGNYIKSPVQLYLGLVQDLQLDVAPLRSLGIAPMRSMGQVLFSPPNVRGWVGGRNWINSATLTARRQLVQNLFTPINEATLNADEKAALADARDNGRIHFTVDRARLSRFNQMPSDAVADTLLKTFLAGEGSHTPPFRDAVVKFLKSNDGGAGKGKAATPYLQRVRDTAITLLQTPDYQLC